jgi:hypothetical protein
MTVIARTDYQRKEGVKHRQDENFLDANDISTTANDQTITGTKTFATMPLWPVNPSVAAAGSTSSDATPVLAGGTVVSGADGTKAVSLPSATVGAVCFLYNFDSVSDLIVFGAPGALNTINGSSSGFTLAAKKAALFVLLQAHSWSAAGG